MNCFHILFISLVLFTPNYLIQTLFHHLNVGFMSNGTYSMIDRKSSNVLHVTHICEFPKYRLTILRSTIKTNNIPCYEWVIFSSTAGAKCIFLLILNHSSIISPVCYWRLFSTLSYRQVGEQNVTCCFNGKNCMSRTIVEVQWRNLFVQFNLRFVMQRAIFYCGIITTKCQRCQILCVCMKTRQEI